MLLPSGEKRPEQALLSTNGAFELWSQWPDRAAVLLEQVAGLARPDRGWQEGRYERGGAVEPVLSAITNAVVLEALLFRARGPVLAGLGAAEPRPCGRR